MTVSVGCHFRTTYLQSTSSWRENIKYTQIMKHIEKLIRYSLPEPNHYLSYGGALSIWSRTFYDEARFSWTKSFVCRKHAIRIFGCSCYDGNVTDESLFMFSQLGGLLCQLAAAASQVGVLTRTTASGPRPVAERTRASARRPSSLRPLSRSAAVAVTSAYALTKLLRKSRVSSEDVSICLHYGQSNDLIENATGLRGCWA